MYTVAQIHSDFFGAEDRILQEAKELLSKPLADVHTKAERVRKLGFGNAKVVKDSQSANVKKQTASETVTLITHYRQNYPFNKFINEEQVKLLCDKYSLVLGDASNYIGDIPEKNIQEIEKFSLKKEDWTEKSLFYFNTDLITSSLMSLWSTESERQAQQLYFAKLRRSGFSDYYLNRVTTGLDPFGRLALGVDPYKTEEPKKETEQATFKIWAPKHEFNTAGYVLQEGYKLVYDPIVLQPVKGGYLIVTAWGDEASDPIVVNETSN